MSSGLHNVSACPGCGETVAEEVQITNGVHHAKLCCAQCGKFIKFLPKPKNEGIARRPANHRELVNKFSGGFCEMCRRREDELPLGQTLEAHHVDPYCEGGEAKRENVWIVCTFCHRMIEMQRTYLGHYHKQQRAASA